MNRYLALILSFLLLTLTSTSYAKKGKSKAKDDQDESSNQYASKYVGNDCEKLKTNLQSIQQAQNKVTNQNKSMPQLRREMNTVLAKLAIYEGVEKKISQYLEAKKKLITETAKEIKDAKQYLDTAEQMISAYEDLQVLHAHLKGNLNDEGKIKEGTTINLPQLRKDIDQYLNEKCHISYWGLLENPYDPIALRNNFIAEKTFMSGDDVSPPYDPTYIKEKKDHCLMVAGLAGNMKVLMDNKDKDIDKLIENVNKRLTDFMNRDDQILDKEKIQTTIDSIKPKLEQAQQQLHNCYHSTTFQSYQEHKSAKVACQPQQKATDQLQKNAVEAVSKSLKEELNKLDTDHNKKERDLLNIKFANELKEDLLKEFSGKGVKVEDEIFSLCEDSVKSITEPDKKYEACLKDLGNKVKMKAKIADTKKDLQKLQEEMIALREKPEYYNLELAKKLILIDQQKYCLSNELNNETAQTHCSFDKDNELGTFIKLNNDVVITVDDLNQVKKGVYLPGTKLANLCRSSAIVKKSATFICQRSIDKAKEKEKMAKIRSQYHVYYDKKGEPKYEKRDSNTTIAVTSLAGSIMPALNSYLAIDGLEQQNNYLYQQAVMQKNMNYLSDQQFQWYMQNYTLYGADPYSLSGGYDPYYMGTFQFGNPNFTAYSGYYSY